MIKDTKNLKKLCQKTVTIFLYVLHNNKIPNQQNLTRESPKLVTRNLRYN
ncbi:hypothetical protein HanRHA438_Chr13g0606771 [Helianthus annuus]|nr:hypothetical protein HanRHA438_Chr13g0606771 [Helianthus annuus]